MEDLKSLLIGILGGLIVLAVSKFYKAYRVKKIRDDISLLEYERSHLEEMKRSSVEMNRSAFRSIFAMLSLMGFAKLSDPILAFINGRVGLDANTVFSIIIWGMFFTLSVKMWQRYDNLKNYKDAIGKMDTKLSKLQQKLEKG